jgi:hypothetical protein
MVETRGTRLAVGILPFVAFTVLVPGCRAPGEPPAPWVRRPFADSRNVAMRPAYDAAMQRPFAIGGYAGASYAPGVVGRRGVVTELPPPPEGQPRVTVSEGSWEQE